MEIRIPLSDEEKKLAASYAETHGMTLEQAFKAALFEQIEDEEDAAIAEDAYEDYVKSGYQSRAIEELWKKWD